MAKTGWYKTYRSKFDDPLWLKSTPQQKVVMEVLLGMANFDENEWEFHGKKFHAGPGEMVTSVDSIMKMGGKGITRQGVRGAMQRLSKNGFITMETTNEGMHVTIVNWAKYQSQNETQPSTQPVDNQQTTTNKNVKKEKKRERVFSKESVELKMATLLSDLMTENNPTRKKDEDLQKWADVIRLMIERDKRTEKQIDYAIRWSQANEFWSGNILSTSSLRRNFDKMVVQIRREKGKGVQAIESTKPVEEVIKQQINDYGDDTETILINLQLEGYKVTRKEIEDERNRE